VGGVRGRCEAVEVVMEAGGGEKEGWWGISCGCWEV